MSQIKNITERQARKIRQAITEYLGSRQRVFSKKGFYVILNPLSDNPTVEFFHWTALKREKHEFSLLIGCGYYKHQRNIPTEKQLRDCEYILKENGSWHWHKTFPERDNYIVV